jgi:hypothetical protein
MLVAFHLFGHPGGDLLSEFDDMGWVGANVKVHNLLLFFAV